MTDGWKAVKLGDVCDLDKQSYGSSSLPYVGMEDIDSGGTGRFFGSHEAQTVKSNTFQFGPQHLLYGRLRPYLNKVLLPDFEGHCSTEIFPVLCNDDLDKSFLFYWLTSASVVEKINKTCTGARMPRANFKEVLKFNFLLPPLEEQKRIVAILDEAFEGIEKAQANAQQSLANARELFASHLNSIFIRKGKDWNELTLGDICTKIQDGAHHSPQKLYPERNTGLFPYVTSKNIRNNYMDLSKIQYVDADFHNAIYPRCKPELGDVLLTKDGANTGNVTLNTLDEPFSLLSSVCLIKPDRKKLNPAFLKYYIQSRPGFDMVTGNMTGAAIKRIILRTIKAALIPLPNVEQQTKIVDGLDRHYSETQRLEAIYEQKLKDLAELKQSLLQKAFSGELISSNVVEFTRPVSEQQAVATTSPEFGAHVIAYGYHWHEGQRKNRTYGHVKTQKFLHLTESVADVDMGRTPEKCAAGPHDAQHMRQAENWARENQFFEFVQRSDGKGYTFKKLANYNQLIGNSINAVKPYQDKIQNILSLLLPMNTREAEVLATVHAAWNNLLLDNAAITDDAIIHEARENWTESKRSIPENEFRKAITTIRNNGIVPHGTAKRVTGQESLPL